MGMLTFCEFPFLGGGLDLVGWECGFDPGWITLVLGFEDWVCLLLELALFSSS